MRVLLAVDGSACSDAALQAVAKGPWPVSTEIRLVTVDAPMGRSILSRGSRITSAYEEVVQAERQEAQSTLDRASDMLEELLAGVPRSAVLLEGSPREQIVEEARRWGADLIVVGSHGRGAIGSVLLGSVSLAVALQAPCSIWIVRES